MLEKVVTGKIKKNNLLMIYGVEGCGKTTWAAGFDTPLFIGSEQGSETLDVSRYELESWQEFDKLLDELLVNETPYKTIVIDSIDWLEGLLFDSLTKGDNPIEEVGGGYGKWVGIVNNEYRKIMIILNRLRVKYNIIIIGHAQLKKFGDPVNNEQYDRYELKLHSPKSSMLWKEYIDCLLFMNYEIITKKEKGMVKTYGDGVRKIYTEHRPSFDAKNRFQLPFEIEPSPLELNFLIDSCFVNYKEKIEDMFHFFEKDLDKTEKVKMFLSKTKDGNLLKAAYQKLEKEYAN